MPGALGARPKPPDELEVRPKPPPPPVMGPDELAAREKPPAPAACSAARPLELAARMKWSPQPAAGSKSAADSPGRWVVGPWLE